MLRVLQREKKKQRRAYRAEASARSPLSQRQLQVHLGLGGRTLGLTVRAHASARPVPLSPQGRECISYN